LERLKKLYKVSAAAAYAANAVSVLTGFPAAFFVLKQALPAMGETAVTVLAAAVSLALLMLVELGKREFAENFGVPWFRGRELLPGWLFGLMVCFAVSVAASVYGAMAFVENTSTKVADAALSSKAAADSTAAAWDALIAEAEAEKADFFDKNKVKEGGKWVLSFKVREPYAALGARVSSLKDRKLQEMDKAAGQGEQSQAAARGAVVSDASKMALFSAFNESLCLAALLFQFYFFGGIYKEMLKLNNEKKKGTETEEEGAAIAGEQAP
jgi:hypothetical protein